MVAALADIKVTLRQLHPGRDVQILLQEIEDLGGNRFGKAQAASLGGFCEKAVRGLEAFLVNLTALKVFRIGRGPEELKRALGSAALYLNEKCTIWGAARLWAVEAAGGRSFVATETDARNRITEAVRLHVEVVVEAAKRNMEEANRQGRPIQMARHRATNTRVWYEIKALNDSTEFGYKFMDGYNTDLGESKTLNDVWEAVQENMNVERCLGRKLDYIRQEVEAGRRFQEEACCPEVFFLVPADTSSWSALERYERWKIFTKHMQLFFMCTTFFDEIQGSMSMQPEVHKNKLRDECSEFIDIRQPSDFFAKYNQAIKMSIGVIQTIGIATAFFGISVQGVLPSSISNISDLDDLSDIMDEGLQAAKEAFVVAEAEENPILPEERPAARPGPWRQLKSRVWRSKSVTSAQPSALAEVESRMRHDPAQLVMQHYLTSNKVEWQKSVQGKLKLAHNTHHGYTYVCKNDPQHETQWKLRADDARGPMR